MKLKLALFVLVAAMTLTACGGAGTVILPTNQSILSGVYEGTITGTRGSIDVRLGLGALHEDGSFLAELSFPDGSEDAVADGIGSAWGSSFSIVLEQYGKNVFYMEGRLQAETRRLIGTIYYPDREETLDFILFFVRALRD